MTFEQMERRDVDQLRLSLQRREHIGREAGRCVSLTRDPLGDVALGVEEVGAIGRKRRLSRTYSWFLPACPRGGALELSLVLDERPPPHMSQIGSPLCTTPSTSTAA